MELMKSKKGIIPIIMGILFWILMTPIIIILLILIVAVIWQGYQYAFTPYGDSCIAYRTDSNSLGYYNGCPTGYVCTDRTHSSTYALSDGHTIDNPAEGTCKRAFGIWFT